METNHRIRQIVENELNTTVQSITLIGSGATATAYSVELSTEPYKIVVKTGKYTELLYKEKEMLDFLASKVSYKVPDTYFIVNDGDVAFIGMELLEGINVGNKKVLFLKNKKHLADNIIDCFENMQSIHNDKFGFFDNAVYDTWQEFYRDFFKSTYDFSMEKHNNGDVKQVVIDAMKLIEIHFDEIFKDVRKNACISHGDFWVNNMIIDSEKCEVAGIFDPNNVAWVEPEYEIFAITVGYGKNLKLYKNYKMRKPTSKYCDLKIELYALVNELDWYKKLGFCPKEYLYYRAKRLIKQVKKNKLKRQKIDSFHLSLFML